MNNFSSRSMRLSRGADRQLRRGFFKPFGGHLPGGRRGQSAAVLMPLLCFSMAIAAIPPTEKADFMIVENPANLIIYNQYEQQITAAERKVFLPYRALQVLEENTFLSDNFTPCMKIRVANQTYFLLKNHHQELMNAELIGYHQLFRNTTLMGDTVAVLAERALFIAKQPTFQATARSQKYFLPAGVFLKRLFQHRNFGYVETLTDGGDFGWTSLAENTENRLWRTVRQIASDPHQMPPGIVFEVEQKIEEVNDLLQKLFAHFNKTTGENKAVPYWSLKIQKDKITCTFEPEAYQNAFSESRRYLVNSLKNTVLGSRFGVFNENHLIEIRRKQTSQ